MIKEPENKGQGDKIQGEGPDEKELAGLFHFYASTSILVITHQDQNQIREREWKNNIISIRRTNKENN